MVDNVLFGKKELFAIELGYSKNPKKFFLRFWIQNLAMGAFKKASDLGFSKATFKKNLAKKEEMFLSVFDGMTPVEIHEYTKIDHDNEDDLDRLDSLVPLYELSFFGNQFTDTQSEYLILYKERELLFIWKNDINQPLCVAKIPFEEFRSVFSQFIDYCTVEKIA